jgi:hypothetical protein
MSPSTVPTLNEMNAIHTHPIHFPKSYAMLLHSRAGYQMDRQSNK